MIWVMLGIVPFAAFSAIDLAVMAVGIPVCLVLAAIVLWPTKTV